MFPLEIVERKPGVIPSEFVVAAGSSSKPSLTHIEPGRFTVYMDSDRGSFPVPVAAETLAQSIVHDFCVTQLAFSDEAGPGLIAFGELLTEKDLALPKYAKVLSELKARQDRWFKMLVAMGDDDWSRHRRHGTISSLQRMAAKELNLEREWLFLSDTPEQDVSAVTLCPACKALVAPGASVCQTCRCVMNKAEADKFQFAN